MPNNVYERIFKLLAKINMGFLDGSFDAEQFADVLQAFMEKGDIVILIPLNKAINILGQDKVTTADQAEQAWDMEPPQNAVIRYSETTLRECAEQNKQGQADWRLIYCHGLSLRQQREKRGVDKNQQPCFFDNDWWLKPSEDSWAMYKPEPGYYLLNLRGQFDNMSWGEQEAEIVNLGNEYQRCHETILGEAILTIFMVTGKRIAEDWYHWGISLASYGYRVALGDLGTNGLLVYYYWHAYSFRRLRVVLARKFDF